MKKMIITSIASTPYLIKPNVEQTLEVDKVVIVPYNGRSFIRFEELTTGKWAVKVSLKEDIDQFRSLTFVRDDRSLLKGFRVNDSETVHEFRGSSYMRVKPGRVYFNLMPHGGWQVTYTESFSDSITYIDQILITDE